MTRILIAALASSTMLSAAPALAQSAGEFTIGLGIGYVMPKDDNGTLDGSGLGAGDIDLDVGDNARPTLTFEYFVADNIGIELLAAWPFTHDIDGDSSVAGDLDKIAETTHLPPTLSVLYHFDTGSSWSPYVGAGINYTWFYDTDGKGALSGQKVELSDSWGIAGVVGLDYEINERGALRGEVRYIDIDSDVRVNGDKIGKAEIDPWVFNVAYVFKF